MSYDLLILGGGPAGYVAAIRAGLLGLKTLLVEKQKPGGTCLHRGCIPTKAFLASAIAFHHTKNSSVMGFRAENVQADFAAMARRKDEVVNRLFTGVTTLLKKAKTDIIAGSGIIVDPKTVKAEKPDGSSEIFKAEHVLLATGSEPLLPPVFGYDGQSVVSSTDVLAWTTLPQSLLVIGGSVVGCEFASLFSLLGVKVTVIEMLPQILPEIDAEVSRRLTFYFKKQSIEIKTGSKVVSVDKKNEKVFCSLENGETLEAEKALVAIGRKVNTANIGFDKLGVLDAKGFVQTDAHMQTKIAGVYAAGDITGKMMLAHVASRQALIAVEHIAGKETSVNMDAIPACVFTYPEISCCGLTEEKAKSKYGNIRVGRFPFTASGKALCMGETDGFVKWVADANGKLVGFHCIGPEASNLVGMASLAITKGMSADELAHAVQAHPTLGETVSEAAEALMGKAIHI